MSVEGVVTLIVAGTAGASFLAYAARRNWFEGRSGVPMQAETIRSSYTEPIQTMIVPEPTTQIAVPTVETVQPTETIQSAEPISASPVVKTKPPRATRKRATRKSTHTSRRRRVEQN